VPELPEAETLVRGLRPALVGRRIRQARVHHADVLRQPAARFREAVRGRTVEAVGRRAKNVLMHLSGDRVLVVNLGMTGWLAPIGMPGRHPPRPTHPAVTFVLEGPGSLVFDDVRRFGAIECLDGPTWLERDQGFGPEPLESGFTARVLHEALGRSRSPVRSWLLDQRRIAGVGNIYAAEALFRARVHPARAARTVDRREARALHRAIRSVLREAVRAGGTTIRDYRNADGGEGAFAGNLRVYGREGEPCLRCSGTVERLVFAGRSAFFCPRCQPAP
jgi:formamidopyrimidine-DNA glycosylase